MNRYTLEGILDDAAHGKRVAYVGRRAGDWLREAEYVAGREHPGKVSRVIRSNGQKRIEFTSGGVLTFHGSGHNSLRGHTADVVALDADASRDERTLGDAHAVVASSIAGEVIRA